MTYNSTSYYAPRTRKEKFQAALTLIVIGLIFGAVSLAGLGWDYQEQKKRAERPNTAGELLRDLARSEGRTLPEPEPPKGYVVGGVFPIFLIIVFGGMSLLMFGLGIAVFFQARQMIETPEMLRKTYNLKRYITRPKQNE